MDTPKSKTLEIIIPAYRMHTQTLKNALDGIAGDKSLERANGITNHVVWMVGNLVNCRYWLANILGIEDKDPNEEIFKDARALDESLNYPTLESLTAEWHKISPKVYQKLLTVSDEELSEPYEFGMNVPFVAENKLNMVGMCIGREDYLFGQIGLMRRLLGYKGMGYEMDENIKY